MNPPFFLKRLAEASSCIFMAWLFIVASFIPTSGKECGESRQDTYFLFSLARIYFNQGDYERSEELLREAAILDDCSSSLYAESAGMLLKMGKDDAAEQLASAALKLDPDEKAALEVLVMTKAGLAISARDRKMLEESIELCREAIAKSPQEARLRFILVKLYVEKEDFEKAGRSLREFMDQFPQNSEPIFLAAEVMSRAERYGNAEGVAVLMTEGASVNGSEIVRIAELLEGEKDFNSAHFLYQAYLKTHPDPKILMRDAMVLYALGEYEQIAGMFEREEIGSDENADELYLKARVLSKIGKMNSAIESYKKLIMLDPANADPVIELGELLEYMGDIYSASLSYATAFKAVEETGSSAEKKLSLLLKMAMLSIELGYRENALNLLSETRQYGGEKDLAYHVILSEVEEKKSSRAALKVIERAKALFNNDKELLYREAEILSRKKPKEAEKILVSLMEEEDWSKESYQRASAIFSRSEDFERALSWIEKGLEKYPDSDMNLQAGSIMERWGKYQDAEKYLKKAIELEPANATALNYLGYMLAVRGERLEEALSYVTKALEIEKYNGAFIDSMGYIFLKMGDVGRAWEYLERAAEIFPFDPEICDHLGDLHYASRDLEGAIAEWKKAIEYRIESPDSVEAKILMAESELKASALHSGVPSIPEIDSVKISASFKGKLFFGAEKIRLRGMMIIDGAKGRFEFISPLGKSAAVVLLSDQIVSIFLPDSLMLYRGTSNAENLFKVFGIRIEPAIILDLLTGLEQTRESPGKKDASLIYESEGSDGAIRVESAYGDKVKGCGSFVPEEIAAYDGSGAPIIEISYDDRRDLELYGEGRLVCIGRSLEGKAPDALDGNGDETFSDSSFREIAGVEIVDLDMLEVTSPIIQGIIGGK